MVGDEERLNRAGRDADLANQDELNTALQQWLAEYRAKYDKLVALLSHEQALKLFQALIKSSFNGTAIPSDLLPILIAEGLVNSDGTRSEVVAKVFRMHIAGGSLLLRLEEFKSRQLIEIFKKS